MPVDTGKHADVPVIKPDPGDELEPHANPEWQPTPDVQAELDAKAEKDDKKTTAKAARTEPATS